RLSDVRTNSRQKSDEAGLMGGREGPTSCIHNSFRQSCYSADIYALGITRFVVQNCPPDASDYLTAVRLSHTAASTAPAWRTPRSCCTKSNRNSRLATTRCRSYVAND